MAQLGAKVRQRRKALRLTGQQLADRMEKDARQVRLIESGGGNLTLDSLLKLASALDLPFPWLWADELPPVPPPRPRPPRRTRGKRKGPPRTPSEVLAQAVITLRDQEGLTQKALARKSGVSLSLVLGIESGRNSPTLRSLERVARALGVQVVELLGGKPA